MALNVGKAYFYGFKEGTWSVGSVARLIVPESVKYGQTMQTTENLNAYKELTGFHAADQRLTIDIELTIKADTNANALKELTMSTTPFTKVTLAAFDATPTTDTIAINGDWILEFGKYSISMSKDEAKITAQLFRPLTSPYTIDQLLTTIS